MDPFREEFALLNATCARRLELELTLAPGVHAEVLNDYPRTDDGKIHLPDHAYGGEAWALQPCVLTLPAVPATAYADISEDELVIRRTSALEVARLLVQARAAARHQDWEQVQALLASATKLGADNPWLQDIVREMKQLADRRDDDLFSKEGAYSSRRMSTRLASVAEGLTSGGEQAAYLRRKSAQGKQQLDSSDKQ